MVQVSPTFGGMEQSDSRGGTSILVMDVPIRVAGITGTLSLLIGIDTGLGPKANR